MNHNQQASYALGGGLLIRNKQSQPHLYQESIFSAFNENCHYCLPACTYMTTLGDKTCLTVLTINSDLITNG